MIDYFALAAALTRDDAERLAQTSAPRSCESCAHLAYPIQSDREDVLVYRCPKNHLTLVAKATVR